MAAHGGECAKGNPFWLAAPTGRHRIDSRRSDCIPVLGQGTWGMRQNRTPAEKLNWRGG